MRKNLIGKIISRLMIMAQCMTILALLSSCAPKTLAPVDFAPSDDNILVVYTTHKEEVYEPIIREFEERTGIWVMVETGDRAFTEETRIEEENEGIRCDVLFGGSLDELEANSEKFATYFSNERSTIADRFAVESGRYHAFSYQPIVIIYNARLAYKSSIPAIWSDLEEARWTDRIACERVVAAEDVADSVATGAYTVGVTTESYALKAVNDGADIGIVYPRDGTLTVADGCAIFEDAPHAANARAFTDFLLSSDVQQMIADTCCLRPVRETVDISQYPEYENCTEEWVVRAYLATDEQSGGGADE